MAKREIKKGLYLILLLILALFFCRWRLSHDVDVTWNYISTLQCQIVIVSSALHCVHKTPMFLVKTHSTIDVNYYYIAYSKSKTWQVHKSSLWQEYNWYNYLMVMVLQVSTLNSTYVNRIHILGCSIKAFALKFFAWPDSCAYITMVQEILTFYLFWYAFYDFCMW